MDAEKANRYAGGFGAFALALAGIILGLYFHYHPYVQPTNLASAPDHSVWFRVETAVTNWLPIGLIVLGVVAGGALHLAAERSASRRESAKRSTTGGLNIKRAVYGTDNSTDVDVTEIVRSHAAVVLPIENESMGGDPIHGRAKRLLVDYSVAGGQSQRLLVQEHDLLVLPDDVKRHFHRPQAGDDRVSFQDYEAMERRLSECQKQILSEREKAQREAVQEIQNRGVQIANLTAERDNARKIISEKIKLVEEIRGQLGSAEGELATCKKHRAFDQIDWFVARTTQNIAKRRAEGHELPDVRVTIRFVGYERADYLIVQEIEKILRARTPWAIEKDGNNHPALEPQEPRKVVFFVGLMSAFAPIHQAFSEGALLPGLRAEQIAWDSNRDTHPEHLVIEVLPTVKA